MDVFKLKIIGYTLAACTNSNTHGIATYVKNCAKWKPIASSHPDDEIEWTATEIEGTVVINVYKPPNTPLQDNSIPVFACPCMYAGDFNSHSTIWGYRNTNAGGIPVALENWASAASVQLLFDPKQPGSFHSSRWKTTNPDLAFTNTDGPLPERIILEPFPKFQHRPSLIISANPLKLVQSKPVKRWNFRKANWAKFTHLVQNKINQLPKPTSDDLNTLYKSFCNILFKTGRKTIPRRYRRQYIPSWDEECKQCYDAFLASTNSEEASAAATTLMNCLDTKRRQRWEETVRGTDFTHSSRVAWKTFNRLTGRSSHPKRCPVTANSIAHQLMDNVKCKVSNKKNAVTEAGVQQTMELPKRRWLPIISI